MIKKRWPKNSFFRSVITLMTGATLAQAIPVIISPVLTRMYTPDDFGVFALYVSVVSVLSLLVAGRYEMALMLPEQDVDAKNLLVLSVILACVVSLAILLAIVFFSAEIALLLGNQNIERWLYLVPLSIFMAGIFQGLTFWNNRRRKYKTIAAGRICQSAAAGSSHLGFGVGNLGYGGLILGNVIGQTAAVWLIVKASGTFIRFKREISLQKMLGLAKEYRKFPIIVLPSTLIDGVRVIALYMLISRFFSGAVLGQYALAWRGVSLPLAVVAGAVSQVYFKEMAVAKKGEMYGLVKSYLVKSSLFACPVFIMIYLYAPWLFETVFGGEWTMAGKLASVMAPWLFMNFLTSPLSTMFVVLNKQEVVIGISLVYMLVPAGSVYFYRNLELVEVMHSVTFMMVGVLAVFLITAVVYSLKFDRGRV